MLFEIFEKKNFNNFGRNCLASWFYKMKKTRWKTLFLQNTHKNLRLSWKLLRCSKVILLREWKFWKNSRRLFVYLIAEKLIFEAFYFWKKNEKSPKSKIENRKSKIEKRKTKIENRKSKMENANSNMEIENPKLKIENR